jgi:MoaA/NifB/PqqE/SkfB family radical SAM enzyme
VGRAVGFTNLHEIPEAAALARRTGCRYLELKPEMQSDHHVAAWSPDERAELRRLVEAAQGEAVPGSFDVLVSETLRALTAGAGAGAGGQVKRYDRCAVARLRCTITPQGVFPCAYHRGVVRLRLGEVVETSFTDAWRRADLDTVVPSRDCGFHCARHEQNEYVWGGAEGPFVDDDDPFL